LCKESRTAARLVQSCRALISREPGPSSRSFFVEIVYPEPPHNLRGVNHLAKPNYAFAKRQREIAKKQKNDQKQQRKLESTQPPPSPDAEPVPAAEKPTQQPGSDV
jgi:hypothetical protein